MIVKKGTDRNGGQQEEPQQGSLLLNIGKTIFLIVVLVIAWFILEKLIGK